MMQYNKAPYDFPLIIAQFSIKGRSGKVVPHGAGHIHDTFRVMNAEPGCPDYLLQRINHHIFKNIPALTENILHVTSHLRKKMEAMPGNDPDKTVLTLVPTKNGRGYYKDEEGNYWRLYYYLENTKSYNIATTVQQAYEGGKAFGKFQALLADLDARALHETIPHFHNVENRFALFQDALRRDPEERTKAVAAEVTFVNTRMEAMSTIHRLGRQGKLPLRITHNDTKFNNVLLDNNDKAQCVIDLDTVMPGYVAYDFGDAIRTIINKAPEDEKDLGKIKIDMGLFTSFTEGFLEETATFMTEAEVNSLASGVLLLPFIMGLRFLTDYIEGDHYYKISFPDHNIYRSRAQFKLVERLEAEYDLINKIIQNSAKGKISH